MYDDNVKAGIMRHRDKHYYLLSCHSQYVNRPFYTKIYIINRQTNKCPFLNCKGLFV